MKRDCRVELLRCVLMFLIVLSHTCHLGAYSQNPVVGALSASTIFATCAFVFVSGWYGIRFSWSKVVRFAGLGVYAAVVISVLSYILGFEFAFGCSLGWFGAAYLGLMFISPLVNAGIMALKHQGNRTLLSAWWCYAALMAVQWLCSLQKIVLFDVPGWYGHSFNTVLFVYVTARVAALTDVIGIIRTHVLVILFCGCSAINLLWAWAGSLATEGTWMYHFFIGTRDFGAPFVLVMSILVVIIIMRLPKKILWGDAFCFCAPSMFSIYLLHHAVPIMTPRIFYRTFEGFVSPWSGEVLSCVIAACVVMAICLAIDLVRRGALKLISFVRKEFAGYFG